MRHILLGAAIAAIGIGSTVTANAADGSAYMAQCKANIQSEKLPAGSSMNDTVRLAFCQCIVDSGDQSVIDEGLAMAKLPRDQRFAKMSSTSDKYQAAVQLCGRKLNLPPPPAPGNAG